ncbi:response regulator [Chryseobacterium balustinum]|uniref:Response regulator receiver domain-containing protein n=1 Tax=Chryseobacterium balustinum TaxID=246 RepID=A0ABY1LBD2_9FLAO|nr:response regulator [Chryseobacterium balustinum]AZB32139.1 response regulator [Chryseobacterium balustinum]SKB93852.1 Response regulator receiver domain-containing protein [Chryseobacterium balustinum]
MNTIYFHQKSGFEDRFEIALLKSMSNEESIKIHTFSKEQIEKHLPSKFEYDADSFDVLLIPTVFDSSNYMSYDGIEFALFWYFHLIKKDKPFAIVLLGTESTSSFFQHCDYSNFFKCPNVHYVDFNYEMISTFLKKLDLKDFSSRDYLNALKNVNLKPSTSYKTHHSIANEWAIYRWANTIGATDKDIDQIENKVENQLYFKYLQTIFPVSDLPKIEENELKIRNLKDSKILYIDDEADKGWYEIFCKILVDINEVQEFDYLGDELKDKSQEEIINLSLDKIKEQDTDIVILDFRLHENDFTDDVSEVTGLKILKEIKKINPGIQVIIFSATNKIWNLQALQKAGTDGFIVKESPENSVESKFTEEIIRSFTYELDIANKKKFLKNVFVSLDKINNNVCKTDYIDDTSFETFLHLLSSQTNIIKSAAKKIDINDKSTLDIVFLNCFNFLENFKNEYYLNYRNYSYSLGINEISMNRYSYNTEFSIENKGLFSPNNQSDKPTFFITTANIMINYLELCNHNDIIITKLGKVTKYRNDFIHGTKHHFEENEIILILEILVLITSDLKE